MTWTATTDASAGDIYAEARWDDQVKGNLDHIQTTVPHIHLSVTSAVVPLSGITPAPISQIESSAGSPKPNWHIITFDKAADEGTQWNRKLPRDYGSSPVLRVSYYMTTVTTNEVVWACQIAAISDGDSILAKAFDSVNTVTDTVPGTAGIVTYADITLTNADSMAAGDKIMIYLYRDADNGDDDADNDANVTDAELLYSIA